MRKCKVGGCKYKHNPDRIYGKQYGLQLCEAHWLKHQGELVKAANGIKQYKTAEGQTVCCIEGCGKTLWGKGLCRAHYLKWYKWGDPEYAWVRPRKTDCKIEGCTHPKTTITLGMCDTHYLRYKRHGSPEVYRWEAEESHGHCLKDENGKSNPSKTYKAWANMKQRCQNPKHESYHYYGGRGIKVCEEWSGPTGFRRFLKDMGECPEGFSIERIDVDGDYEPSNCKWATMQEQQWNKRSNRWYKEKHSEQKSLTFA